MAHNSLRSPGGLKGRDSTAQGEALGADEFRDGALQGLNNFWHNPDIECRPFRAWLKGAFFPGLRPGLSNYVPLGLRKGHSEILVKPSGEATAAEASPWRPTPPAMHKTYLTL
jgi:hypothetical protein